MAYIRCKGCNSSISNKDITCPICNTPIDKVFPTWKTAGVALSVIVVSVAAWMALKPDDEVTERQKARAVSEALVLSDAFAAVKSSMKDPGSAEFGNTYRAVTADGRNVVCGTVNGKNSFGGYVGFKRFIYIYATGTVAIDAGGDFNQAWHSLC